MLELLLWILIILIAYSYILYPVIIGIISVFVKSKQLSTPNSDNLPTITLFITAYNEAAFVKSKMDNSLCLNYPKNKLDIVWVTDGSDDSTNEILKQYPEAIVHYQPERNGKTHAMKRGMEFIKSDIVVFSDGNTALGKDTLLNIAKEFENPQTGCVAGEKRVIAECKDTAASSGESIYWKYESWLKGRDAKVGSCIGAAGELFAIRTNLFIDVPTEAILDDFMLSIKLAMQGYKVAYNKNAYAMEKPSANIKEEMKRKVRIAAGAIQSFIWLLPLLNFFKYGILSFQYISHKVFRWIIVPVMLPVLFFVNTALVVKQNYQLNFYTILLALQIVFYLSVVCGRLLQNTKIKARILFVPYYFFMANLAMWRGCFKYAKGKQSVNWERAQRAA